MPLSVRNLEANKTVFAKTIGGDPVRITWGAAGQPDDTQRVPDALANDIDFLNTLDQGVFQVVGGPQDLVESLQVETAQVRAEREERERRASEQHMDRRQDRDIIGVECIGPAPAGRNGICGKNVLIRSKSQDDTPPLCSQHESLAPTYYLVEAGSKGEGATESRAGVVRREWRRTELTAPARAVVTG